LVEFGPVVLEKKSITGKDADADDGQIVMAIATIAKIGENLCFSILTPFTYIFNFVYTLFQIKVKFDFDGYHSCFFNSYSPLLFCKWLKFVFPLNYEFQFPFKNVM